MEVETSSTVATKEQPSKAFLHRTKKKSSAREIRQRQNRRLRKLLTPKNALMALYELIGNKNCDFKISSDAKGFIAEVLINNVRYEGRGKLTFVCVILRELRLLIFPKVLRRQLLKITHQKRLFAI